MPETCFDTDWMAEMVVERFPDLLTLYSPPARDPVGRGNAPSGTFPSGWTAQATAVPCRVAASRLGSNENEVAARLRSTNFLDVYIPIDTVRPLPNWRMVITTMGNRVLEITGDKYESDAFTLLVEAKEIR